VTILVRAGFALPNAQAGCVTDFAVAIDGSRIIAAGAFREIRAAFPGADVSGGPDLVMLPAMCDSHDHGRGLGTTPLGIPDDILEVWLVQLAQQPRLDPYLLALFDGLRLVRSGVSTVLHSHNLRDVDGIESEISDTLRGYRDAGIRVVFDLPITDQNMLAYDEDAFRASLPAELNLAPRQYMDRQRYFDVCASLARQYAEPGDRMVTICVGPSGPQWASDELMQECVAFAQSHHLRMHVHALETWYQREYAFRQWRTSLLAHLDAIGLLGPWLTLAHAIWLEPSDYALLADRGVGVAHNPSSNLRLRSGVADVPRLLAEGVSVGIGLDGHTLDEDQDMLREVRLAWTLANRPGASAPNVGVHQALEMATRSGFGITLGPDVPLGRLEPGYLADLVLVEPGQGIDDWSIGLSGAPQPVELLPALLVRGASRRHVRDVMVGGRWIVREHRSTCVDEHDIADRLRENLARQANASRSSDAARVAELARALYTQWGDPPARTW
jgi:5-methylthioadenosine/S-adenosylhomocysteine deaminase